MLAQHELTTILLLKSWLKQPCNKSAGPITLVTSWKVVNKFMATCLLVCYNLCVFTCVVGDMTILLQLNCSQACNKDVANKSCWDVKSLRVYTATNEQCWWQQNKTMSNRVPRVILVTARWKWDDPGKGWQNLQKSWIYNPFQCDEFASSDIEEAYPAMVTMQQWDSDHEEDSDIDIL